MATALGGAVPSPLPPSPRPVLAQGMLGIHDSPTRVLQVLGETIITPPLGTATSMGVASALPSRVSHALRTPSVFHQSAEDYLVDHWSPTCGGKVARQQGSGQAVAHGKEAKLKHGAWVLSTRLGNLGENPLGPYERKILSWGSSYF